MTLPSTMLSRERLVRTAEAAARLATARRARLVAQVLLVAGLVFVSVRLRSIWNDGHVDLAQVDWLALCAAFLLSACTLAASGFIWLTVLRRLGAPARPRWVGIFLQAQLGKYIPGSVWQYAGRTAYAADRGIPARTCAASIAVELVGSALAAAVMAPLLLGWWGALVLVAVPLAVIAGGLRGVPRRWERHAWLGAGLRAWLLYLMVWPLIGLGFWLCARGLVPTPARDIPYYAGAFAVAWLVGLAAVYAPGGIGVREAVLVAFLAGRLGTAEALLAATASRGVLTLVDLVLGASGAWLIRGSRARPPLEPGLVAAGDRRARTSP